MDPIDPPPAPLFFAIVLHYRKFSLNGWPVYWRSIVSRLPYLLIELSPIANVVLPDAIDKMQQLVRINESNDVQIFINTAEYIDGVTVVANQVEVLMRLIIASKWWN